MTAHRTSRVERPTEGNRLQAVPAPPVAQPRSARDVVEEMFSYAAASEQPRIETLLHPEAIVVPLFDPERVVRLEEFAEYVREQTEWATFKEAHAHQIDEIEPGRFLVAGVVRWSHRAGGFTDSTAHWAVVVRDGMVYRVKGAYNRDEVVRTLDADDWRPRGS